MKKLLLLMFVFLATQISAQLTDGDCNIQNENDMLVFEAERFELKGDWKLGTSPDASGSKYIYFSGPNSYTAPKEANNISYTFPITEPGTYVFRWTMRQPEGERGTDLGNDAWFYFSDDIARGNEGEVLDQFYKFVGRSDDTFTLNGTAEVHHKAAGVSVVFPAAGNYTLNLSGRSHEFELDRIVMYRSKSLEQANVEIKGFAETTTCDDNDVEGLLELIGIETTYPNKQSTIPFKVNYITTEDRELFISLRDNTGAILQTESRLMSEGAGILDFNYVLNDELTVASRYSFYAELRPVGTTDTENITTTTSTIFTIIEGDVPPEVDEISFVNPPLQIANNSKEVTVKVNYSATKSRDIILSFATPDGRFIKNGKKVVALGKGETNVSFIPKSLWNGKGFKLTIMLRPNGGIYKDNLDISTILVDVVNESDILSVESLEKKKVYITQNPFNDAFSFNNDGNVKTVKFYNLSGQEVLKHKANKGLNVVPTNDLSSQIYIARFEFMNNSVISLKVIKN